MRKRYPKYKDSGIEWLGRVPDHWEIKRLKYAASINSYVLAENTDPDFSLRYIDIGNVDSNGNIHDMEELSFKNAPSRARRVTKQGDTILSTVRTYLKAIAFIPDQIDNLIVSTGFAVIHPNKDIMPKYMNYVLQSEQFINAVVANSEGVGYPAINPSKLACLPIWAPNLPEQETIINYLSYTIITIGTLIDRKSRQIDLLKEKRAAVITRAVTKGLDPNVPKKDSGVEWLDDVPEHWVALALKRIVSTPITDGPHETPDFVNEGIPFVSAEAIKNERIDFSKMRGFISAKDHNYYCRKYKPMINDIYIIKSGATTGNVAIVETDQEFSIWSPLAAVRVNRKIADPRFVLCFLKSQEFRTSIQLGWSFGTQQNIGMDVIENIFIRLPPLTEQKAIVVFIDRETGKVDSLILNMETAIEKLREYRSALISAAVTGKIDVRGE